MIEKGVSLFFFQENRPNKVESKIQKLTHRNTFNCFFFAKSQNNSWKKIIYVAREVIQRLNNFFASEKSNWIQSTTTWSLQGPRSTTSLDTITKPWIWLGQIARERTLRSPEYYFENPFIKQKPDIHWQKKMNPFLNLTLWKKISPGTVDVIIKSMWYNTYLTCFAIWVQSLVCSLLKNHLSPPQYTNSKGIRLKWKNKIKYIVKIIEIFQNVK